MTEVYHMQSESRPTIVCLCGSTRFSSAFRQANFRETLAGKIVLSIGCDTKSDEGLKLTAEDKTSLDELHLRKIELADEILVLNVGGYIGESTKREIEHARKLSKWIRWLEEPLPRATPTTCKACSYCGMEPDSDLYCGHPDAGPYGQIIRIAAGEDGHCGPQRPKFEQHRLRNPDGTFKVP